MSPLFMVCVCPATLIHVYTVWSNLCGAREKFLPNKYDRIHSESVNTRLWRERSPEKDKDLWIIKSHKYWGHCGFIHEEISQIENTWCGLESPEKVDFETVFDFEICLENAKLICQCKKHLLVLLLIWTLVYFDLFINCKLITKCGLRNNTMVTR